VDGSKLFADESCGDQIALGWLQTQHHLAIATDARTRTTTEISSDMRSASDLKKLHDFAV